MRDWARLLVLMCGEPSPEGRRLAAALATGETRVWAVRANDLLLHGDDAGAAEAAARLEPGAGRVYYEATWPGGAATGSARSYAEGGDPVRPGGTGRGWI